MWVWGAFSLMTLTLMKLSNEEAQGRIQVVWLITMDICTVALHWQASVVKLKLALL